MKYLNRILKEYKILSTEYLISKIHTEEYIYFIIYINKNLIKIKLNLKNRLYPFTRPDVHINDMDYIKFLTTINIKQYNKLKKIKTNNCLCCNSILCNWGACLKVKNILGEIKDVLYINQRIKDRYNSLFIQYYFNIPKIIYTFL